MHKAKAVPRRRHVLSPTWWSIPFLVVAIVRTFWTAIFAGVGLAGVGWVNVALTTLRQTLTARVEVEVGLDQTLGTVLEQLLFFA